MKFKVGQKIKVLRKCNPNGSLMSQPWERYIKTTAIITNIDTGDYCIKTELDDGKIESFHPNEIALISPQSLKELIEI